MGGGAADPVATLVAALFASGEKGGWWSFRDTDYMYSDVARTTKISSSGTGVAALDDRSGNGNHLFQSTAGSRPTATLSGGIWKGVFDGGDLMKLDSSASLDVGTTTVVTVIATLTQSGGTLQTVFETGRPVTGAGFSMVTNYDAAGNVGGGIGSASPTAYNYRKVSGLTTTPRSNVFSMVIDTTQAEADEFAFRVDSVDQSSTSVASSGSVTGNVRSASDFTLGATTIDSSKFNDDLYDLIIVEGDKSASLAALEAALYTACGFG